MAFDNSTDAFIAIMRFAERYGEHTLQLAMYASVPQGFSVDLLFLIGANLIQDEAFTLQQCHLAVADLLHSPLCIYRSADYYEFDAYVRPMLLNELTTLSGKRRVSYIDRVANFLLGYVDHVSHNALNDYPVSTWEKLEIQRWTAYAFLNPDLAAKQIAVALKEAQDQPNEAAKIQFTIQIGTLASALTLPLSQYDELLDYIKAAEALAEGKSDLGEALLRRFEQRPLKVGDIELDPATMLAGYRVQRAVSTPGEGDTAGETPAPRMKFFLAYVLSDTTATHALFNALREQGQDAWVDDERLGTQGWWEEQTLTQIEQCDVFVFFISEKSVQSSTSLIKLRYAVARNRLVIPVMLDNPNESQQILPPEIFLIGVQTAVWNNEPAQTVREIIDTAERFDARGRENVSAPRPPYPGPVEKPSIQTKFFVSYALSDAEATAMLSNTLNHLGLVWGRSEVSRTQAEWDEVLDRIEQCDVFVFLVSEASVQSPYSLAMLRYAVARNRLILPVMLDDPERLALPPEVATVRWAIWSNEPAQTVLEIFNIAEREDARRRPDTPAPRPPYPVPVEELAQRTKFFLSYSHSDRESAHLLVGALRDRRQDVWMANDLVPRPDRWEEILNQIELCETFIFLVSEQSVQSPICLAELRYARTQGGSIIPIALDKDSSTPNLPELNNQLLLEWSGNAEQMADQIIVLVKDPGIKLLGDENAPRPPYPGPVEAPSQQRKFFISYVLGNKSAVRGLAVAFREEGQDIWHSTDTEIEEDSWDEILNQIERCDVFVFLVSQRTVNSPISLAELRYALARKRPVVPVRLDDFAEHKYTIPPELGQVRIIAWKNNPKQIARLIMRVAEQRDISRYADVFAPRPPYPSIAEPPPPPQTKFFLSYAPSDKEKAKAFVIELRDQGHDVWWDSDIKAGQDWWDEALNQIEQCDVFVFLISEKSVQSSQCLAELRYAVSRNRLVIGAALNENPFEYTLPPELDLNTKPFTFSNDAGQLAYGIIEQLEKGDLKRREDIPAPRPPLPVAVEASRPQKRFFLSCCLNQTEFAETLTKILTAQGQDVWLDDRTEMNQEGWEAALYWIELCDVFVFLVARETAHADMRLAELRYALARNRFVIPLVFDDNAVTPRELLFTKEIRWEGDHEQTVRQLMDAAESDDAKNRQDTPAPRPPLPVTVIEAQPQPSYFLSYALSDSTIAISLSAELSKQGSVRGYGELGITQIEWEKILDHIEQTQVFVFLVSQASAQSPICLAELRYALARNRAVLGVILEGTDYKIPDELTSPDVVWFPMRNTTLQVLGESIAARARDESQYLRPDVNAPRPPVPGTVEKPARPTKFLLSYAVGDSSAALRLGGALSDQKQDFLAYVQLEIGQKSWDERLNQIEQCEVFVFFVSQESAQSSIGRAGLRYALARNRLIIPVMLEDLDLLALFPEIAEIEWVRWDQDREVALKIIRIAERADILNRPDRFATRPPYLGTVEAPPKKSSTIVVNYELLREMRQAFQRGIEGLEETQGRIKQVATRLEEGALLGRAGDALADALKGRLVWKIRELIEKSEEMIHDLQAVEDVVRAAERKRQ